MKLKSKFVTIATLAFVSVSAIAWADAHSGIDARKTLMKANGGAAKVLGDMAGIRSPLMRRQRQRPSRP
jgi:cytochrome c556